MDLFRELPSSVQRQARSCLHAPRGAMPQVVHG
jgi:hypothetical protein